jgi:Family of unknown function (DUF6049)
MTTSPDRRRASIVTMLIVCMLALLPIGGRAPSARAQAATDFDLELVSQPVWHDFDDRLDITVRVVNNSQAPLMGFNLVVGALPRSGTRSELHDDFDLSEQEIFGAFPLSYPDVTVGPGSSRLVTIRRPITSFQLSELTSTGEPGVYPVKISLHDDAGNPLGQLSTQLIYYPQTPDDPLRAVVVMPLEQTPQRGPDGVFRPDDEGRFPLESALGPGGELVAAIGALERTVEPRVGRGLHIGIAPTPRLMDEINDMSDGYRRLEGETSTLVARTSESAVAAADFLSRLRSVLASANTQALLTPYAAPDLPSIAAEPDAIDAQMEAAADTVADVLEVEPSEWMFAPGARLDADSLTDLSELGVNHTFFSADTLIPPDDPLERGCPEATLSFACPVSISTRSGEQITGYTVDEELQDRLIPLARPGDTRLELQQLFAETAMIREELPSSEGRVIQLTIPRTWRPQGRELTVLLNGLARAPWLQTLTPNEGLTGGTDPADNRQIVSRAENLSTQPDPSYFDGVREASALVAHFDSVEPPDSFVRRLNRNLMVAQSRAWWDDLTGGQEYIDETEEEVGTELGKVGIFGGERLEIALTSRRGEIPITIFRNTDYPVSVNVVLESTRLELEDNVLPQEIERAQERVTFEVVARSSGEFPLNVRLTTPDGYGFGDVKRITIRSTAFNRVALGITFGALAFLILFYVVRVIRRRRAKATPA